MDKESNLLFMQLEIYQWLAPLLGLTLIFRTIRQYLQRHKGLGQALIWITVWVCIGIIALLPVPTTSAVARFLGFESNVNAIIFAGLGLLYFLIFYLFSSLNRLDNKMTALIRQLAKENPTNAQEDV